MHTPFRIHPAALAVALLFPVLNASAQSSVAKLDDIVVTSSRTPQLKQNVIGDVTVIDSEELNRAGQSSVAEILSRHAGIQFDSSGGPQTVTGVGIRGNKNNHTLVLVDGVRINSSALASVHWNAINPAAIERIEILRGAASSLYGSDAIGGVVNIITRKGQQDRPLEAWVNMGIGSYDTVRGSLGLSGASHGWDYSLTTAYATSDGFDATYPYAAFGNHVPDEDGYTQNTVSGSLGYTWKEGHHIGLTAYNSLIDGDFDAGNHFPGAHGLTRQQTYTITSTNAITNIWQSVLRLGISRDSYEDRAYQSGYGSLQRTYSWQNNFQLSRNHHLSAILERIEERPWQNSYNGDFDISRRNTNAGTLIYRGTVADIHHIQASIRHDRFSNHGNRTTGSLAYDLDLTEHWSVGVAGSTGFRIPTFSDLYSPYEAYYDNGLQVGSYQGNPNLKPEKSRNIEARLSYDTDTTHLGFSVFQNKVRDLINPYVCDISGDCTTMNTERATIRGITLAGRHQFGDTDIHAAIDLIDPKDNTTDNLLVRRARTVYRAGIDRRFGSLSTGAEYIFTGKRYDDVNNNTRLGGFGLLNLTAAYDFSSKVRVQARWNNVFDKKYSTAYGYRSPGSNIFVDLTFKM